ncbi:LacI family DNA-binding transcriptional regulator [Marinoscillum furvescens]|uniref:LacI family transcriptional regulator n=1 Tax=Marinoscillum furvescens DSM 4134 TaxID=1122208 RepID=A0A3D9KZN1_MARFU|nr:LacI family DNA-binding transcriptional regulator [Marinoscillum furvescens]RED93418.1 LacI family transcriptional regulator [Marinoscillum furvescens DSM 4134]
MKQQKTTIHDIAKALNTTASTVSRALNNHPRISQKTKDKVAEMARKLGYEPNTMASSLRLGHSKIIGIIVPYVDRIFFSSVIRGIEEQARKHGYNVIICQSHEKLSKEIEDVNTLLAAQVAGIIISISKETRDVTHLLRVQEKGKPLVLFDRTSALLKAPSVTINDFDGAYQSVVHLIKNGYQRIAHIAGDLSVSIFKDRLEGYKKALRDHQVELHEEWIIEAPSDVAAGRPAIEKLMQKPVAPDAFFFSSDFTALGAVKHLQSINFKIPDQIGIVGFGNDQVTQYFNPALSSVDQKSIQMGDEAARIFMDCLQHGSDTTKQVVLAPKLIVRKSSCPSA